MGAESHLGGHVRQLSTLIGIPNHIRTLCSIDACEPAKHSVAKLGTGIRHGERGAALAALGIHYISTSILHMLV